MPGHYLLAVGFDTTDGLRGRRSFNQSFFDQLMKFLVRRQRFSHIKQVVMSGPLSIFLDGIAVDPGIPINLAIGSRRSEMSEQFSNLHTIEPLTRTTILSS